MSEELTAQNLFDATRRFNVLEDRMMDELLVIAGMNPHDPDTWSCAYVCFDWYDTSAEYRGADPSLVLSEEQAAMVFKLGFQRFWIVYTDGTERYYYPGCVTHKSSMIPRDSEKLRRVIDLEAQLATLRLERDGLAGLVTSLNIIKDENTNFITKQHAQLAALRVESERKENIIKGCIEDICAFEKEMEEQYGIEFCDDYGGVWQGEAVSRYINSLRPTWTSEKPKVPGWYWWIDPGREMLPGGRLQIVEVVDERSVIFANGQVVSLDDDDLGGQWCGPLPLPSEG